MVSLLVNCWFGSRWFGIHLRLHPPQKKKQAVLIHKKVYRILGPSDVGVPFVVSLVDFEGYLPLKGEDGAFLCFLRAEAMHHDLQKISQSATGIPGFFIKPLVVRTIRFTPT